MPRRALTTKQSNIVRLRFLTQPISSLHSRLSTLVSPLEPSDPDSPPVTPLTTAPSKRNSTEKELLKLLNRDAWNDEELHTLLPSISPPRLPQIFRRLHSSTKALKLFRWIQTHSPSSLPESRPNIYQALFELACKEQNSQLKLQEILQTARTDGVPLTIDSATILINHFAKAQMIDKALDVFNNINPSCRNTHLCNTILDVLYRCGQVGDAQKVLDEMLQPESASKSPPNALTTSIVFSALLKRDRPGKAMNGKEMIELVAKLGEHGVFPDAVTLTKLISMMVKDGNLDQAWEILHKVMKMDGGRESLEAASFNALLAGLVKANKPEKMSLLHSEMQGIGIERNGITYGIIINHLCKSRRIDAALQVLDSMREHNPNGGSVIPDIITYNTIIKGLCSVGRQQEGLDLVKTMRTQYGYTPNTITYNALINGFCKAGEIERARELFDQMTEEGVPPDVITLNTLVDGMCKHGRISSALEFFKQMQKKGLKGNTITYTSFINALCHVNNLDKAMELFNDMISSNCRPDSILFYALINGFSRAGKLDDAWAVASKMKSEGLFLDVLSYNVLINGFCKKKKFDKAYELVEEMETTGVSPDMFTYNTLISSLSETEQFSAVNTLMKKMTDQGLIPNVVTYGALLHGYCKAGKLEGALEIFKVMDASSKVPPNTVIYNILIDSLCKENRIEEALSFMDGMREKGVLPNVVTYNAMLKGLRDMNCLDKAFEVMDNMKEQGINPDYLTMELLVDWLPAVGETDRLKSFCSEV